MFLDIFGIIITILIGLFPIIYSYREKTIRYWHIETESLFSRKIREFKDLKILYEQHNISDDMIFIKVVIENNGLKDIDKNIIHTPFTISFDKQIELLEVESLRQPNGTIVKKENNSVICNWNLLKKNEFILLKILLKSSLNYELSGKEIFKKYTTVHSRITDSSKHRRYFYSNSLYNKTDYSLLLIWTIILLFASGIFFNIFGKNYVKKFQSVFFDGDEYSITASNENTLVLTSNNDRLTIDINEYNSLTKDNQHKLNIHERFDNNKNNIIAFIIFIFPLLIPEYFIIKNLIKQKKIKSFVQNL